MQLPVPIGQSAMHWIFLSPHLDDAAFSCGGLITTLVHSGNRVEIWTICAGDPPDAPLSPFASALHQRWGYAHNPVAERREEDRRACALLGAHVRHFDIPDCVYRRNSTDGNPLIEKNEDLFQPLPETELPLVDHIRNELARLAPVGARLVSPLALGGHMDHQLVRRAAEALQRPLYYYADYPYAGQVENQPGELSQPGWEAISFTISEDALRIWQAAIAEHRGQISTFWSSQTEMESKLRTYWQAGGGSKLWRTAIRSTNDYKT